MRFNRSFDGFVFRPDGVVRSNQPSIWTFAFGKYLRAPALRKFGGRHESPACRRSRYTRGSYDFDFLPRVFIILCHRGGLVAGSRGHQRHVERSVVVTPRAPQKHARDEIRVGSARRVPRGEGHGLGLARGRRARANRRIGRTHPRRARAKAKPALGRMRKRGVPTSGRRSPFVSLHTHGRQSSFV